MIFFIQTEMKTKVSKPHTHCKTKKTKLLKRLKSSTERIKMLETRTSELSQQIQELIRHYQSVSELKTQNDLLHRKITTFESTTVTREQLIQKLLTTIEDNQKREQIMKQTIKDLRQQLWPPPFFDAANEIDDNLKN